MNNTVSFDLYEDMNINSFGTTNTRTPKNVPTADFRDSNTSINSLFDAIPSTYTSMAPTPMLSRSESLSAEIPIEGELNTLQVDTRLQGFLNEGKEKMIVMMVGLPASGKSTICRQLNDFINQLSEFKSNIYNAGDIRRKNIKFNNSDFFDPNNTQGRLDRELYADINVNNMTSDLKAGDVQVGFLDATNTTVDRRRRMIDIIRRCDAGANIVIMDIQCTDEKLLNFNVNGKAHNVDYQDKDYLTSVLDFKLRTRHYYKVYQPITELELSTYPIDMYIKFTNGGVTVHQTVLKSKFVESRLYNVLNTFSSGYYHIEGKRYVEAVDLFYKNNPHFKIDSEDYFKLIGKVEL